MFAHFGCMKRRMVDGVRPETKLGATQLWSGRESGQAGDCRGRRAG